MAFKPRMVFSDWTTIEARSSFLPSLTASRSKAVTLLSSKNVFCSLEVVADTDDDDDAMMRRAKWSETDIQMSDTRSLNYQSSSQPQFLTKLV